MKFCGNFSNVHNSLRQNNCLLTKGSQFMDLLTLGKIARDDITPFSRCARYYKTSHRSIPESSLLSIMPITSFFFRTQSAYTGEDLRQKMRLQVLKTITKLPAVTWAWFHRKGRVVCFYCHFFSFYFAGVEYFWFFMAARICVGKLLMKKKRTSIVRVNASSSF